MEDELSTVHERLNKMGARLTKIEAEQPFLKEILERNTEANEQLTKTLNEMQTSMALMNNKMDLQAKTTEEHFKSIDERMESMEEKGTFDIHSYIKSKWPLIIVLIGLGAAWIANNLNINF